MSQIQTVKSSDVTNLGDGIVIDVRTRMEHDEKRLSTPHVHAPLDTLTPQDVMLRHGLDKASPVYLLCRSGKRAAQAAEKFLAEGYTNVKVVEGGIIACEDGGHPVEGEAAKPQGASCVSASCRSPVSLERQVMIVAGAIIAVGALMALAVSSWFAFIPLVFGGSLVFAGVTDRCALALILAKAPWNAKKAQSICEAPPKTGASCQ